jgi:hypothetical protein
VNTAQVDYTGPNGTRSRREPLDPIAGLCSPNTPKARVSISVGTQHDYGRIKVAATVSYECDQTQGRVDEAGVLAFTKAVEFMTDSLDLLLNEQEKTP